MRPAFRRRGRRLGWGAWLLGAAIAVALGIAAALGGDNGNPAEPPIAAPAGPPVALDLVEREGGWFAAAPLDALADSRRATVSQVIDGDTVDVLAAQERLRVRFFGIDTPERGEACFAEASARTTTLLGREVLLVPDSRLKDPGGRELRYVFSLDGRSIDATLVADGLARAWRDDGALRDRLVAIEDDARRAQRGCLWS